MFVHTYLYIKYLDKYITIDTE